MPTGNNLPSLFRLPKQRLKLEWHRIKQRSKDYLRVLMYRHRAPKPRPALGIRKIGPMAQAMHNQMYTAFAECVSLPLPLAIPHPYPCL